MSDLPKLNRKEPKPKAEIGTFGRVIQLIVLLTVCVPLCAFLTRLALGW